MIASLWLLPGVCMAVRGSRCESAWNKAPVLEWAPWGGQESGCGFDHRPGIEILELLWAEIAQR
jgi:hypothetical protein